MKTLGDLIDWASAKVQGSPELTKMSDKARSTELTKVIIAMLVGLVIYLAFCKGGGGYRKF